jgi:hypothetical protein
MKVSFEKMTLLLNVSMPSAYTEKAQRQPEGTYFCHKTTFGKVTYLFFLWNKFLRFVVTWDFFFYSYVHTVEMFKGKADGVKFTQ